MKILVVDDDLALCTMLSRYLEKHGFSVHSAGDALQALDILAREEINLVITDLMMPYMNGVALIEQLKADQRYANLPVILVTAYPEDELIDKGLRKGVSLTLPKPIDFERLLNLVRFAM